MGIRKVLQLTQRDIDRLKVLHLTTLKKNTQKKAGELLGICREQVNRLCQRIKKKGEKAIIHGLRGHSSNHQLPPGLAEKIIKRIEKQYADFGPTLVTEKLLLDGIKISTEKVRKLMITEGLWQAKKRKARHRKWRERKDCPGEMIQTDGSFHDWFEERRDKCVLLASIDDASNKVFLRFTEHESTKELMRFGRTYVERFGRPLSFYVDKDSIYVTNREANLDEELKGKKALTQFTRAMETDLEIEVINAHSPQAKGRVERLFRTLQDRLIKELRLANISTIEEANQFLEKVYIPWHNQRFGVEPKNPTDVHRPLRKTRKELDVIFSIQESRILTNDYTIRWRKRMFQVEKHQPFYLLPRTKVVVEERLNGIIKLRYKNRYLKMHEIDPQKIRKPSSSNSILPLKRKSTIRKRRKNAPRANHPWRKDFKRWRRIASIRRKTRSQQS